jgi:hypothetical protein
MRIWTCPWVSNSELQRGRRPAYSSGSTATSKLSASSILSRPISRVEFLQLIHIVRYGKYIPQIGPQTRFPLPPGIVNNRGNNTLAISLWAQSEAGARLDKVQLINYGVYESGFGFNRDWSALQPSWTEERLNYK